MFACFLGPPPTSIDSSADEPDKRRGPHIAEAVLYGTLCWYGTPKRGGIRVIIFGTKGYLYTLAMMTLVCGRCGNPAAHTLKKQVTKFTLFFVPLFPITTKYVTQCTFCGAAQQLAKEQAEQLQAQAVAHAQPQQGYGMPAGQPSGHDHQHPTA